MKTAIIYATSHGTSEKVARLIAEGLKSNTVDLFNLKKKPKIDISAYDTIVIGGSIHAGTPAGVLRKFINKNMLSLLQKKVALFLCCMNQPEEQTEFDVAFPEYLRSHSVYNTIAGGEYVFEEMNFIEKAIIRKITGATESLSKLRYEEIQKLVNCLNSEIVKN